MDIIYDSWIITHGGCHINSVTGFYWKYSVLSRDTYIRA